MSVPEPCGARLKDLYVQCGLVQVGAAEGHTGTGRRGRRPWSSDFLVPQTAWQGELEALTGKHRGGSKRRGSQVGTQRSTWGQWVRKVMRSDVLEFMRELAPQSQLESLPDRPTTLQSQSSPHFSGFSKPPYHGKRVSVSFNTRKLHQQNYLWEGVNV